MAGGKIEGEVISITPVGNLVTSITADQLSSAPRDERVQVQCDEHETFGIFPADHQQPAFTFLAVLSETGPLELVIVGESARDMLGIRAGAKVLVKW